MLIVGHLMPDEVIANGSRILPEIIDQRWIDEDDRAPFLVIDRRFAKINGANPRREPMPPLLGVKSIVIARNAAGRSKVQLIIGTLAGRIRSE